MFRGLRWDRNENCVCLTRCDFSRPLLPKYSLDIVSRLLTLHSFIENLLSHFSCVHGHINPAESLFSAGRCWGGGRGNRSRGHREKVLQSESSISFVLAAKVLGTLTPRGWCFSTVAVWFAYVQSCWSVSVPFMLQDVKVFSEDGTSKVVEILADMTARDLCQLLVYKSHCVDDNSWTLVEHHPHLGLGREWSKGWHGYLGT